MGISPSPAKDTTDKVKKFEDMINKYEDFTQNNHLDSIIKNSGLQNIMKGIGIGAPGSGPVAGSFMSNTDYSKILQDMLKSTSGMFGDKPMNPSFLPDNFNKHM